MTVFYQAAGTVLLACILGLALSQQNKEFSLVLTIGVCCMVLVLAVSFLSPVLKFLRELEDLGGLDDSFLRILMKVVGIGLISEIARMVCTDAGNGSLGKALQIMGTAVILWLSIPVFQGLLELIQGILGGI